MAGRRKVLDWVVPLREDDARELSLRYRAGRSCHDSRLLPSVPEEKDRHERRSFVVVRLATDNNHTCI